MKTIQILDAAVVLIALLYALRGRARGALRCAADLAAVIAALIGAYLAAGVLAPVVAERILAPWLLRRLTEAAASLAPGDALRAALEGASGVDTGSAAAALDGLMRSLHLPAAALGGLPAAGQLLRESAQGLLAGAADAAAERLAWPLLFLLSYLLLHIVLRLLLRSAAKLAAAPKLLGRADRLLGFVLGAAAGLLLAGVLLAAAYWLIPSLSAQGGALSGEALAYSHVIQYYFRLTPGLFRR